jgi:hypothetical protein
MALGNISCYLERHEHFTCSYQVKLTFQNALMLTVTKFNNKLVTY